MEWIVLVVFGLAVVVLLGRLFRRRPPVCPWCGRSNTFGPESEARLCSNCGFDFDRDDY
jgi:hypothetical protein